MGWVVQRHLKWHPDKQMNGLACSKQVCVHDNNKDGQVKGGKFDIFLLGVFLETHFQCAIKLAEL